MTNDQLTHIGPDGASHMVDVGEKAVTHRSARASALVRMKPETLAQISGQGTAKGNPLEVARLAGIMAAKQTGTLIPLCHPLPLENVEIAFTFPSDSTVAIEATARVTAKTGVEMEAMVAASVAALTLYDMCKAIDRTMTIEQVRLEEKSGGRSGQFVRSAEEVETLAAIREGIEDVEAGRTVPVKQAFAEARKAVEESR
jgi:cyclic pyranopterin phosphate synthase